MVVVFVSRRPIQSDTIIVQAQNTTVDTSKFNNVLDGYANNVEKALNELDDHIQKPATGGTGLTDYATGDIIYVDGYEHMSTLHTAGNAGKILTVVNGVPTWDNEIDGGGF